MARWGESWKVRFFDGLCLGGGLFAGLVSEEDAVSFCDGVFCLL